MADWVETEMTVIPRADHFFAADLATIASWALDALARPITETTGETGVSPAR
jgi:alpha/beta superfamily hydrolase